MDIADFSPRGVWRNGHVQSTVASLKVRRGLTRRRAAALLENSAEVIIDCGKDVRLLALHAAQPDRNAPVAILIHGWEGSADSLYLVSAAGRLFDAGFDVWRLQLRDHGKSHHLNRDLFHSCRLDEVVAAVGEIQARSGTRPLCLGGFSLGGNFSLRVAARADAADIDLAQVVAICPVLHPPATLDALEQGLWLYHAYFMRKWRRSLRIKHRLFPQHFDIDTMLAKHSMRELTSYLATEYGGFPDVDTYLQGYSIVGDRLSSIRCPATLLMAKDDPVIPIHHVEQLDPHPQVKIVITEHGGHCGYLDNFVGRSWADQLILSRFSAAAGLHRPRQPEAQFNVA